MPYPVAREVLAERVERKRALAVAFRAFARCGFDLGLAGHISARDPECPNHFWVNPLGLHFSRIRAADLLLVDDRGQIVVGSGQLNRAAFAIHSAIHTARPDVVAACHAHTINGRAWSAVGGELAPLTQDSCAFHNDLAVYDEYHGVVFDPEEGKRITQAVGHRKAAILRNHGLLTVGKTVDEAAWWFISLDDCCHVQLLAQAAGSLRPMRADVADSTAQQVGSPTGGWRSFQPLRRLIEEVEPDALDDLDPKIGPLSAAA